MYTPSAQSPTSVRVVFGVTFCVWTLLMYSAVYWGLKWMDSSEREWSVSSVQTQSLEVSLVSGEDLQKALGGKGVSPSVTLSAQELQAQQMSLLNSRVRLVGVAAAQSTHAKTQGKALGVALISLDQQAAKPFKVGDQIEPGLFVLSMEPKSVSLGPSKDGPITLNLVMPALKGL